MCTEHTETAESSDHLGFEMHRLMRLITRSHLTSSASKTAEQLTKRHSYLLRYLFENESHNVYQRDIEKKFSLSRSAVTSSLQAMEKSGLVMREGVDEDARLKRICLTPKAKDLHLQIEREIEEFEARLTKGITEEERMVFLRVIRTMRENLEEFK